jgi:predicted site-specific integrase-resolvase
LLFAWGGCAGLKPEQHINRSSDLFSGCDIECLYAAREALRGEGPIAYCRVSSAAQRPDLKNQRRVLEDFCAARGVANVAFIEEVGGGLNLSRAKFVTIMDRVQAREVSQLIVAHKHRLVRFGFQWFERLCTEHRTELLVLNNDVMQMPRLI